MKYDILVYNVKIYTMDNKEDIYHNMLIKDGKVTKLIKEEYLPDDIDANDDVEYMINGRKRVMIPGFIQNKSVISALALCLMDMDKDLVIDSYETLTQAISSMKRKEKKELIEKVCNKFISSGITFVEIVNIVGDTSSSPVYKLNKEIASHLKIDYHFHTLEKDEVATRENGGVEMEEAFPIDYKKTAKMFFPMRQMKNFINSDLEESGQSPFDAFKGCTYDFAKKAKKESSKGLLKEGYDADFMLLEKDPFSEEKIDIMDIKIMSTHIGGKKIPLIMHKVKKRRFDFL